MEVQFKRTGEKRYAVTIFRDGYPTIAMNPAPGYDPIMPHDLAHLIVEKVIGIKKGVYGQLAAGGHAGTFHLIPAGNKSKRDAARLRRKAAQRGAKLLREGRADAALAERAVHICLNEWLSRASDPTGKKRTVALPSQYNEMSVEEVLGCEEAMARVCASLEWASEQWTSLKIGEYFSVSWSEGAVAKTPA